jgi:predicted amidophosphoribosyltransferase
MGRTNRPETVVCQSCGERINRESDACPECGVANEYKPSTSGAETVVCQSCGESIKKKADVCPECGVANEYKSSTSRTETVFCHSCGEEIKKKADVCPGCGIKNKHKPSTSGDETVFCHSCGEEIKKNAEVCPECGVANEHKPSATTNSTTTDSQKLKITAPDESTTTSSHEQAPSTTADSTATGSENIPTPDEPTTADEDEQEQSETDTYTKAPLSKSFYLAVFAVGCGMLWLFTSAGFRFFFISWILIPVMVYNDAEYVQATASWNPSKYVWAFLTLYPVFNIFVGLVYLIKRYSKSSFSLADKIGSTADSTTEESTECTDTDSEDAAIDQLRKQYVNGELNDYEFERRLEKVVETEDTEAVKERIKEEA